MVWRVVVPEIDIAAAEAELRGKTLIVYWYFVRHVGSYAGVREVQRALKFSSPSVASHHLEKLTRLGLLKKNDLGEYALAEDIKVGFLKLFVKLGRVMLPRYLLYASLFTAMMITYIVVYRPTFYNPHEIVALTAMATACIILWYETILIYIEVPF